jgi:hypothetical protein
LRLCLDCLAPRASPVAIELPPLKTAADAVVALSLDRQGVGQWRDHGGEADDMSRAVSRWLEALQLDARLEKEEEARSGNHRIVFELDPELKCTPPARLERA